MNTAILQMTEKDIKRFWSKVEVRGASECWPWKASVTGGYGRLGLGRRNTAAQSNQVALFLAKGAPDPIELWALHHCDFKLCCNAAHLFWGTNRDNQLDASSKGLCWAQKCPGVLQGVRNGRSKLNDDLVRMIRTSAKSSKELARDLGVVQQLISQVRLNQIWRHV